MTSDTIDIVALMKNPLTKLPGDYDSKLLEKIRLKLTTKDQQMFIANFCCYLNYKDDEFVINLDHIWKWLGFKRMIDCRRLLISDKTKFIEGIDYIMDNIDNQEYITITIPCFRRICMRSNTEKSIEICEYFIQLQDIMYEILSESCEDLVNRLKFK